MKVSSTDFQYLQHQVGFLSRVANADDAVAKNLDESHRITSGHVIPLTTYSIYFVLAM